jgi:DNA mismatch repair protein MutS2
LIQTETLELLEWSRLCQHLSTFAATKLGAIAARHLRIPNTLPATQALLDQTQEVYTLETRLPSGLKFDGIQDIGESLERAELQAILSGEELLSIATTLAGCRALRRTIEQQDEAAYPVLHGLVADLRTYPELEQEIHHCIDDRAQVTDRATPKLTGLREQLRSLRDHIHAVLHRILQSKANAIQESLITQRSGRYVLPVKASHKDLIPGIVHDTSMSGATLYIEPQAVVTANNQLRTLQRQEQVEEETVRRMLTEKIAAVQSDLERLLAIATTLDLATARARYSLWLEANPPRFIDFGLPIADVGLPVDPSPDAVCSEVAPRPKPRTVGAAARSASPIVLRRLRHPLLVWQQQHESGSAVVPVDLIIQPHIRVVAITGPNTGGKTVTLKTLGLAVLMAKVGLFVPAREPVELPWFDQVLADIGDEQSLQQSLSTFSGHIRRIVRILDALQVPAALAASESLAASCLGSAIAPLSLVLLDEVGAGTDPTEGTALAIALLKYLAAHAGLTVATTHFGELKALKYGDDRFENASVEFDDVSLSPTYRLLWGIPGRSNALAIAQRLGLGVEVIQQAQTYVGGASADVNEVIAGLEAQRRRQEQKSNEAAQLLAQAEILNRQISDKASALRERERDLQVAQEQAVQAAIAQAKHDIAKVIRQLQQGPMTAQSAQQATDAINQIGEQALPSRQLHRQPPPKPGFMPKVGDRIRIPRLGQTAEVLTTPNDDRELTVRFGLMKMTVHLDDIESLAGEKVPPPPDPKPRTEAKTEPPKATTPPPLVRTSRNTLDIRGNRVADSEPALERAIAENIGSALWIIHGHGTGKLRQGVHAFLKTHPQVSRFELAPREDGGTGVTIAYLD